LKSDGTELLKTPPPANSTSRGPKFDRRALPYQHPHDRLTFLPDGHVLRIEELRARLYSLGS
jgi:hypothetical protein